MKALPEIGGTYRYHNTENSDFRVIDWNEEEVFLVSLKKAQIVLPKLIPLESFRESLESEEIERSVDPYEAFIDEESLSDKQIKSRDLRWDVVNEIWSDSAKRYLFFERSHRSKGFKMISDRLNITPQQAKRLMSQFWQRGMTPNSLIPQYRKRGTGIHANGVKPGPKGGTRIQVNQKVRDQFEVIYQTCYLTQKMSIQSSYDELINRFYSDSGLRDSEGRVIPCATKDCPSLRQFSYWIQKNRDKETEDLARKGKKATRNNSTVYHGSSRDQTEGPGSRYEMDLTHLNISLVSSFDRSVIIGKPKLFSLIDVYSRMVTGIAVSMENESNRLGAMAIFNCAQDKVEFARQYGIEISEEDWPAHYLPERILYDNGAFKNNLQDHFKETYYVNFEHAPAGTPTAKATVERHHRHYKDFIEQNLPGSCKSHGQRERGEKDFRLESTLTLEELTKIIILLTLHYNKTVIQDFNLEPEMILDGVKAKPVEIWQWGVEHGYGSLKTVTRPEELRLNLLPRKDAYISQSGIRFQMHDFVGADRRSQHILNNHLNSHLTFCYNPIDFSEAYLFYEDNYYPLKLRTKDSYKYEHISLEEINTINDFNESNSHQERVNQARRASDLHEEIDRIVREAKAQTPEHSRKDLKGIRENKRDYIQKVQQEETSRNQVDPESLSKEEDEPRDSFYSRRKEFLARKGFRSSKYQEEDNS